MNVRRSEESFGVVFKVNNRTTQEHRLHVLKHCTQIRHDKELVSGPLDKPPAKQPSLLPYVIKTRLTASNDAYYMSKFDQAGEAKVDKSGRLIGGRRYLISTFQFPNRVPNLYLLIEDLIKVVHFEGDQREFLDKYDQFYPIHATDDEKNFLKDKGLINNTDSEITYVTALSAFICFGASIVVFGCRIIDDYWEQLLKEQGFSIHSRVFPLSKSQVAMVNELKPVPTTEDAYDDDNDNDDVNWLNKWESPYPTIQEQPSLEIRHEYAKEHSRGEHISVIVPGQTINGSLELSLNYKIPKYHYKNSFINAVQNNIQDIPIGKHKSIETIPNGPVGRPSKRSEEPKEHVSERDHSLNINGWKFESLPLAPPGSNLGRTSRGLPYYEKKRLLHRLRRLTPNQVRELEHIHDSVNLNTGLGKIRQVREVKWTKYWQYKSGAPLGLTVDQVDVFKNRYLTAVLNHAETETVYGEERNVEIVHTTRRKPNANFLNHSNISGLKPPYVEERKYK
ncbi:Swp82p Ecym_1541 [Eremothecium cymbalariae DBVPG|uniref:Uncharacterized protein n=1 Tax=Eremothecium cymbalariae (strain CBS 270.75 / DBVPG 7215 / KCTC 17166 / NRRL Y-17582) TaxID=931890 RepID=G8JMU6_ERECY|nr:hypothetical protein Ecym_1541 [Eremothecium cymbalariae DBVPG\